jgi:hypothetical protein
MNELDYITQKELLQYHLKEVEHIAKSQFIEIDNQYNLIKDGENYIPEIKITDSVNLVMITIRYKTQPLTELYMTKPKWIKRERMMYTYKKVKLENNIGYGK